MVNTRANMLSATDITDGIALDKYSFVRDAYLQRGRSRVEALVRDGKDAGAP
jgi:phospholipid-binding lipoprotein MlaA